MNITQNGTAAYACAQGAYAAGLAVNNATVAHDFMMTCLEGINITSCS